MCPCPCMSTGTTKMHPHGPAYIHTATESPHFPASARPHTDRHAHTHTYADYCAKVCKDEWLAPCSGICTQDLQDVFAKCSGCKGGKNFCVDSEENSEDNKKQYAWEKIPMAPRSCKADPSKTECVSYVVDYIEAGSNVPSDIAVYQHTVTDAEVMETMTGWAPRQCRPPFHEWFKKDAFLCKECHSVAQEAEHAQQALWGGAGFCDYANECNCPDQDSCDVTKISACFSSRTPCQCACRDALTRAQTVCGATTTNSTGHSVAVNPPMCDPKLTSACTINSCKDGSGGVLRWSDKESQYKPTESNWGGDNQCVVNGEYSSTCSTSLADMNAEAKANYLGRMISGCRLGAERSCVDAKYQYDKPFKDLDSLSSGRRTRASAPACHLSLLAIVAVFLMGQRL